MARSFKTYVVGNYEDEIYDAIDDYLQEHPEELAKKMFQPSSNGRCELRLHRDYDGLYQSEIR